jgi:hypothetical protein
MNIINKKDKWAVVDQFGEIKKTFRLKFSAMKYIRELRRVFRYSITDYKIIDLEKEEEN